MLEYFLLRWLCSSLGNNARAKGYTAFGYQAMLVGLWFGGEISGFILGCVLSFLFDPKAAEPNWFLVIVLAYGSAAAGTFLSFMIVKWLPDNLNPNLPATKDQWSREDALQRFQPRAAAPGNKDITTDAKERARQEDERYSTE
jgi:hypothetical protein